MLIFLDTEFAESDQGVALISMALVDWTGRRFYAEMPDAHYRVHCNDWVNGCVLPELTGQIVPVEDLDDQLDGWLASYKTPTLVTDMSERYAARAVSDTALLQRYARHSYARLTRTHPLVFTEESCGTQASVALQGIRDESYRMSGYPRHHALGDALGLRAMFRATCLNLPGLYV